MKKKQQKNKNLKNNNKDTNKKIELKCFEIKLRRSPEYTAKSNEDILREKMSHKKFNQ